MINTLSSNINKEILERLVEIHKNCILSNNSKFYGETQIKEWLTTVNIQNIKYQLDTTTWITITNKNTIVGFAQYCLEDKELYQIQIDTSVQNNEYGRKLYDYIEKDFITNKISKISLLATLNAVPFYEKLGFKFVKKIKFKLIKTRVEMIEMSKELTYKN